MVWFARSMLPLALLSPTGLSLDTISVGMCVPALCVDVDDARFLVALQYHFLMTCGQHVVRGCSFRVTMTRPFARHNVSKECLRAILTYEQKVCGELRHAAKTRLMVWAFFTLATYAVTAPVLER